MKLKRTSITAVLLSLLMFVSTVGSGFASAEGVPDDVLHDAILTLAHPYGEFLAEGHVVVATEETDQTAIVYASAYCENFGFMAGIFTEIGGGFSYAVKLTFDKSANGYTLREAQIPEEIEDGTRYWASVEEMMPKAYAEQLRSHVEDYQAQMIQQTHEQAQRYVESLGRTERVGDYRDLNLQYPNILDITSYLRINFYPSYPLEITEHERVENGVRYIYSRTWEPDGATGDSQTYPMPGGGQLLCNGTTGTETLTKTSSEDNAVVERITVRAELYDLYITFADEHGTKDYHYQFDGETYHQPTVTETGSCQVSYPGFDMQNEQLPQ